MKHFKRFLLFLFALFVSIQTVAIPVLACHQQHYIRAITTTYQGGAGYYNAPQGYYGTVTTYANNGNNWHGQHGYNRGYDASYNNYPHHQQQPYYNNNAAYHGQGNGYTYSQPYNGGYPHASGLIFRRVQSNW
jgi:hypothetical protein